MVKSLLEAAKDFSDKRRPTLLHSGNMKFESLAASLCMSVERAGAPGARLDGQKVVEEEDARQLMPAGASPA